MFPFSIIKPAGYTQGPLRQINLMMIHTVRPSGDTNLILGSNEPNFKELVLQTSTFDELSLLTVGFQELLKKVCAPKITSIICIFFFFS